jgi:4-hydroxy-2-oxoheptanedioate aldolase
MQLPKNKFKANLHSPTHGIWHSLVNTYAAEICAGAGFDWVVIDPEHAPFELTDVLHHLQVLSGYPGVSAVVRPPGHAAAYIKRLLDLGAQSLIVPMVNTVAEAEALVRAMRYPPEGIRGVASALARASAFGKIENYTRDANQEMCLVVQIETVAALENIEAIAAVNGVDGLFIGPADLAASMGYHGDGGHPDVVAAIETALSRIKATGKAAGILCFSPEMTARYTKAGATILAVGVDLLALKEGIMSIAQSYFK